MDDSVGRMITWELASSCEWWALYSAGGVALSAWGAEEGQCPSGSQETGGR